MEKMLTSKIFWGVTVILAIIIFIFNLNMSRAYRAEIEVMLLPKNEIASQNMGQIVANAAYLPRTLNFYENRIAADPEVTDEVEELPGNKKLEYWRNKVKLEVLAQSGILKISLNDPDQWQAEALARATAKGLGDELGQYYDIRTELQARIVDGPVLDYAQSLSQAGWTLAFSFFLGLAGAMVLYLIFSLFIQMSVPIRKSPFIKVAYPQTRRDEFPAPIYPVEEPFDFFAPDTLAEAAEQITDDKKASAPQNLPIEAMPKPETALNAKLRQEEHILASVNRIVSKNSSREATPEEVKERLNKLLRGDV